MGTIKKRVRRLFGSDWLRQEMRILRLKYLPKEAYCYVRGHVWDEPEFSITDGPLDAHPREREYIILDFYKQCDRCLKIVSVPYSEKEAAEAIEEAIQEDEEEWPELQKMLSESAARKRDLGAETSSS